MQNFLETTKVTSTAQQFAHMLTGAMYHDLTPELVAARQRAVLLTDEYNRSFSQPPALRQAILERLLGSVGRGVHFEPSLRCEFGINIHIGNNFYANFDCILLDAGGIHIGNDVLLGPRVGIYTANHARAAPARCALAMASGWVRAPTSTPAFPSATAPSSARAAWSRPTSRRA